MVLAVSCYGNFKGRHRIVYYDSVSVSNASAGVVLSRGELAQRIDVLNANTNTRP